MLQFILLQAEAAEAVAQGVSYGMIPFIVLAVGIIGGSIVLLLNRKKKNNDSSKVIIASTSNAE